MKALLLILFLFISSCLLSQEKEDWVYFSSSIRNNDTLEYFYDNNSIEYLPGYISITTKEAPLNLSNKEFDEKAKKYIKERIVVNHIYCEEKMDNPIFIFKYFEDGTSITYDYSSYSPEPTFEGSIVEELHIIFCK